MFDVQDISNVINLKHIIMLSNAYTDHINFKFHDGSIHSNIKAIAKLNLFC